MALELGAGFHVDKVQIYPAADLVITETLALVRQAKKTVMDLGSPANIEEDELASKTV